MAAPRLDPLDESRPRRRHLTVIQAGASNDEVTATRSEPVPDSKRTARRTATGPALAVVGALLVLAVLIWQGITSHGAPDPTRGGLSHGAVIIDTGVLVFREGLEAILVLAALTASLLRTEERLWRPVALGAALSLLATVATWFVVVWILTGINAPELDLQAATGLLAVVVLLVIMNWFFHRMYWTGWISMHNRRKRALTDAPLPYHIVARGLVLVGFTSIYREGFEVVLFLQNMRLRAGTSAVMQGAMVGVLLTCAVAGLVFLLQFRLPYKKMLILTGTMLGAVLIVMVGESVQEMQLAHWLPTTAAGIGMRPWLNTWFAVYPSVQSLVAQAGAALVVLGSYVWARRMVTARR